MDKITTKLNIKLTCNWSAIVIQRWWKKYTKLNTLKNVYEYLLKNLSKDDFQTLSDNCNAISNKCTGDGAGLTAGALTDMFLDAFLKDKLAEYTENHVGESDMKICDIPLSLKRINGKSTIALDWSKNENDVKREHFTCDTIIINLKTETWWKKNPTSIKSNLKISYNEEIVAGIYLVDKQFCKHHIKIASNNKTNTLIESQYLYIMLKRSQALNLFIPLPLPNKKNKFNILNAFSK